MEHPRSRSEALPLRRLSPALGAEVLGFDASAALGAPALGQVLRAALARHQLLLFRNVTLQPAAFRQMAACLGSLRRVPAGMEVEPGFPEVQRLTNVGPDGSLLGFNPDPYSLYWHADGSNVRIPAIYTVLYAIQVPKSGGQTAFADMYAACAALSPLERRRLVGRFALHDAVLSRHFRHGRRIAPREATLARRARLRLAFIARMISPRSNRHPVIAVHEETNRACLYLGDHVWRVTGCGWRTGTRLVDELNAFATSHPEWIYTHEWKIGDLLIWDNRCLLHRGSPYDTANEARVMLRSVIAGTRAPVPARE